MQEEICIRITPVRSSGGDLNLTATLSRAHRGTRGLKMVPLQTRTKRIKSPYVTALTPGLLAAMADALQAVAAGFYEDEYLPFE